jgi:hypothetical protein
MQRHKRKPRPGLDDRRYLDFIRRQPCCAPACVARPPSHAHHITGAGMALKADDKDTMPLCARHHSELHELRGAFRVTRSERLIWQCQQISKYRDLYARTEAA